jgi:hypothetical protein
MTTHSQGFDLDGNLFPMFLGAIYNALGPGHIPEFVTGLMERYRPAEMSGRSPFSPIVDELLMNETWVFKGTNMRKLKKYQTKLNQYRPKKQGSSEMISSAEEQDSESVEGVVPHQESARDAPMLGLVLGVAVGGVVTLVMVVMGVVVVIRRRAAKKDDEYHEAPEIQT